LACKLQYPDMAAAVESDLKQLKLLSVIFERIDRAVDTKMVQQELADRLREELDYEREAKHIKLYRHMMQGVPDIHVPTVVEDLSTDRLLTMEWLDGQRLETLEKRSQDERNAIALTMFRAWYLPFYNYGVIHGDPHMGNYSFQKDLSLNLLDYGCIRVFKPSLVSGVINLYHAVRTGDVDLAVSAYEAWGFRNTSKKLIETLNIWASFIYAPLLEDRPRLIEETNTGTYGRETANRMHAELRKIGGVTIPREFVFMDRAAIGLGSVFLRLKAKVNWYQEFNALTAKYDEKQLAAQQKTALKASGLDN
jgi:predicted unusual protein kinase regulating ubiquinone biosynthesis (AarF/ABC1/UbiB family)